MCVYCESVLIFIAFLWLVFMVRLDTGSGVYKISWKDTLFSCYIVLDKGPQLKEKLID